MNNKDKGTAASKRRYGKIAAWTMLLMVSLAMLLPLSGYVYVGIQEASAQAVTESNPRSNYWKAVRGGQSGYTTASGNEAGVLIQDGNNWRQLRNGYIANYGSWALGGALAIIVLFFLLRRTIRIDAGLSGARIKRWHGFERFVHWATATMFFLLTVTGLSILFGRVALIPLLGPKGFAAWAEVAIWVHNNIGPWFGGFVVLMIVMWMRHNLPKAVDFKWLLKGGGLLTKGHPDAGFLNGGEKIWFWFICTVGVVVIATGLVMNFPNWGYTRAEMQLANLIHAGGAIAWICMWFGHAYIGTIGTEGALEGMTTGSVDRNWAKQHHNLWVDELEQQAETQIKPKSSSNDDAAAKGSPA